MRRGRELLDILTSALPLLKYDNSVRQSVLICFAIPLSSFPLTNNISLERLGRFHSTAYLQSRCSPTTGPSKLSQVSRYREPGSCEDPKPPVVVVVMVVEEETLLIIAPRSSAVRHGCKK